MSICFVNNEEKKEKQRKQTGHMWKEKENQQKTGKNKQTCKQPKIANKQQQETMFVFFSFFSFLFLKF